MKFRNLTGTGLHVSELCLGTMTFGGQTNELDSIEIIRYAIEQGINFIDTADQYNGGASEIATGKGIKGNRDHLILASKVFSPHSDDINDKGLTRRHIITAVEKSLKNLDTNYLDIYYLHSPDRATPIEETLEAMTTLVRSGKVRYIGVSNFASWQICEMLWVSDKRNGIPPVVSQNVYNLLTRDLEDELLPFARKHRIGVVVYNPIAAGLLTGKYAAGEPADGNTRFSINPMYRQRYFHEENLAAVRQLTAIAADSGMSILEFAMKWCLAQPSIISVLTGVSRLTQLEQNIAAVDGDCIGTSAMARCDEVWTALPNNRFKYNR